MKKNNYSSYLTAINKNLLNRHLSKKGTLSAADIILLSLKDFTIQFYSKVFIFFSFLVIPPVAFTYLYLINGSAFLTWLPILYFSLFLLILSIFPNFIPVFSDYHSARMKVMLVLKTYEGREILLLENGQFKESLFEDIYILEEKAIAIKKALQNIDQASSIDLSKVSKHELIKEYCRQVNNDKGFNDNKNVDVLTRILALSFLLEKPLKIGKSNEDIPYLLGSLVIGGASSINKDYSGIINKVSSIDNVEYEDLKQARPYLVSAKTMLDEAHKKLGALIEKIPS